MQPIAIGVVRVAVVQENDAARPRSPADALRDDIRAGTIRIPDAQCPPHHALIELARDSAHPGIAKAMRRAEVPRGDACCVANDLGAELHVELKKGAVVQIRFKDRLRAGAGTLVALLPPKVLRRMT